MSISMFGESSHYQCSDTQSSHVPKRLKVSFAASSVSSAGSYSIATSEEGKCYVWGLVPWAAKTFSHPLELDVEKCVHAQASNQFATVITKNGRVLCIERQTTAGALQSVAAIFPKTTPDTCKILCSAGLGGKYLSNAVFLPSQGHVVQISCGLEHAVILTSSGKLFGWGSNLCRQLDPSLPPDEAWPACRPITIPSDVDGDSDAESSVITQLSCRGWATAVLFQGGSVAMTGALSLYGLQDRAEWILFSLVDDDATIGTVSMGSTFVLATTSSGALYSFGRGPMGELGQGDRISICTEPAVVAVMKGRIVTFVTCGDHHAAAICEDSGDSALFLWGRNLSGECAVHPASGPITTPRLVSEFSSRSGLIPLSVTCGTNFTVVVHSGSTEDTTSELEIVDSSEFSRTIRSETSNDAEKTIWFKKPQTVEGFLDDQLQASALSDSTITTAQLETSASLKSNMFLGRSIETNEFIPFPEATIAGVLKTQIAQSPYLTKDEKRSALADNGCEGQSANAAKIRGIQISNISISGVEVRANSNLLLKIRALREDNSEMFSIKAAPAPLNHESVANIQAMFKVPVHNVDQVILQFRVRFLDFEMQRRFKKRIPLQFIAVSESFLQIKHKDFTGISMPIGECSKGFKFEDWFQSSLDGCQLLSVAEPALLNLTILSKSGSLVSKGYLKASFQSEEQNL